jgi:D-mannonate dehydratase
MSKVWNRKSLETFNIYFPQSNTAREQALVDNFAYFLNNVWRIPVAEHKTYAHAKSVMTARS